MIIFIKLLLAHLIGDFILQPSSWVADKENRKLRSKYLYIHTLIHGLLASFLIWDAAFLKYALLLAVLHGFIDFLKISLQRPLTKRGWFVADQIMHLAMIIFVTLLWISPDFSRYIIVDRLWIYLTGALLLTTPASIIIKNLISIWTPNQNATGEADLQNAGKYIGILERLFVLGFILIGQFAAIGFLLAAKSIFRFGDLTQAKDRKLTEYVLIGTLMSFGLAIATGILVQYALAHFL